jgi:hypothetical protein
MALTTTIQRDHRLLNHPEPKTGDPNMSRYLKRILAGIVVVTLAGVSRRAIISAGAAGAALGASIA